MQILILRQEIGRIKTTIFNKIFKTTPSSNLNL